MTNAISIAGLVKSFGKSRALDGLDFEVSEGEVHGFLGPNGAGKSTTIRILLGLLRADSGVVHLLDGDPWSDTVSLHKRLAHVPGDVELWPNLSGGEIIDLLGRLRGGLDLKRRDRLIERFELDPTSKGKTYSKGNRQKVSIISALASNVELFLFDEPTSGFDPLMEVVFQDVIGELRQEGRTVLLSSHILAQVEKLADRISIIRKGRIVQAGTISQMRGLSLTSIDAETRTSPHGLDSLDGVTDVSIDGNRIHLKVDSTSIEQAMAQLGTFGIKSLTSRPPTLEEIMLSQYGDHSKDAAL